MFSVGYGVNSILGPDLGVDPYCRADADVDLAVLDFHPVEVHFDVAPFCSVRIYSELEVWDDRAVFVRLGASLGGAERVVYGAHFLGPSMVVKNGSGESLVAGAPVDWGSISSGGYSSPADRSCMEYFPRDSR